MGNKFWQQDIKNILDEMPMDTTIDHESKRYMEGCFLAITNDDIMQDTFKETKHIFSQLDARRGTNWKKVFPYLNF